MERLETSNQPGHQQIDADLRSNAIEAVHPPLPKRESIVPSSHEGVSRLAFDRPSETAQSPAEALSRAAYFASGSYGATSTVEEVNDAKNGDVVAMLGVLGMVPGGAWARIAATLAKGGRVLSHVAKSALAIQRSANTATVAKGLVWTHGEVSPALVKAAEKQGGEAMQKIDEYGWRLEENIQSATRDVPIPGSVDGATRKIDFPIVTSTLFDEKGNRVASAVFEGPLWPDHPINRLSGIDVGQRSRVAVLLDQVPGQRRMALQTAPPVPEPNVLPLQHSPHQRQPSPYSSEALPGSAAHAMAQAVHPKLSYDLTNLLQTDAANGSTAVATRLFEKLLAFSEIKATLHGVAQPDAIRIARNTAIPDRLEIWLTNRGTTTLFEISPWDIENFATTMQRFTRLPLRQGT